MNAITNIGFSKDWFTEYMGWILVGAVILAIFVPLITHKFYKGRIRRIIIVKKRTTTREMLNFSYTSFNKSNYAEFVHNTVDFVYDGKKHVHTLNCDEDVFAKLHKDAVYDVVIRFNTIVKVHKKIH